MFNEHRNLLKSLNSSFLMDTLPGSESRYDLHIHFTNSHIRSDYTFIKSTLITKEKPALQYEGKIF